MHLLRQLLICTNCLLLTLTAIFVAIVGIIVYSNRNELDWLASPSTQNYLVYILLGFLLVVILAALFGFCGAWKSSKQCMFLYMSFLAVTITFELATGYVLFRYYTNGEVKDVGGELMRDSMERYKSDKTVALMWDEYQSKMECCGVVAPLDWVPHTFTPPASCCRRYTAPGVCAPTGLYMTGCLDATMEAIDAQLVVLQVSYLSLLVTHVAQFLISCCVLKAIQQDTEYV